jgi:hypothetical protein
MQLHSGFDRFRLDPATQTVVRAVRPWHRHFAHAQCGAGRRFAGHEIIVEEPGAGCPAFARIYANAVLKSWIRNMNDRSGVHL